MEFISPTHGKLSFERMFAHIVAYMEERRDQQYNLIIGTDSLLGDDTCFVTAVVIHRVGHGGRYFYHKFRNRKIESLRQRILFETSLSLETASQISSELAKNGYSELPLEIHLDVGDRGETKRIIREVVGMVQGSGYAAVTKPDSYGASKVADRETGKMGVRPRPLPRPKRTSVPSGATAGPLPAGPSRAAASPKPPARTAGRMDGTKAPGPAQPEPFGRTDGAS